MERAGVFAMTVGVLGNRCPRCQEGRVFRRLILMRERCPSCDLLFAREPGYFAGAMILSYVVGGALAFPLFFVLAANQADFAVTVGAPAALLVLLAPLLVRFSRLAWLWFDQTHA